MRILKLALLLSVPLFQIGCVSDQQQAENLVAADDAQCRSYGAPHGSQAYFQCRLMKDQQRQANMAAIAAVYLSRH